MWHVALARFISIFVSSLHKMAVYSMFVTQMAFAARISDPAIGGTYMTLMNTVCNFGGNWPGTVALWFIDPLSRKDCLGNSLSSTMGCATTSQLEVGSQATSD